MKKNLLTMDILLAKEIKYHIQERNLSPHDKLPSERELAIFFHVQRPTIRSALNLLVQEGSIYSLERKGYFISESRITQSIQHFYSNHTDSNLKTESYSQLFDFQKLDANQHLSSKMLIPEHTPLFKIATIHYEHLLPISFDTYYIPVDIFPNLTLDMAKRKPFMELLQNDMQIPIAKSNQKVTLIYTNEMESQLLRVEPGSPMMKYKGLVYDQKGRFITFFERIMRMERYAFVREATLPAQE